MFLFEKLSLRNGNNSLSIALRGGNKMQAGHIIRNYVPIIRASYMEAGSLGS